MPRNGSGTYSLPAGNPVVAGTTIEASWANTTLNDVATEMTGSLSRAGSGGMTGPLRLDAGTAGVPALAWSTETTTGLYRAGANDVRLAVATSDVMRWQAAGVSVTGTLGVSAAATFSTTLAVTGAATLSSTLAVTGTTTLTGAATLTANPTLSAGTANGVLYLNGSKVATSGSALTFDGTDLATTGTSSATKLIPTGGSATGNGMYLPATNALAWSNNGVETMRLNASGNLGIGTASPNARLTVQQANNTADGIRLFANGSDTQLITRYVASTDAWQVTASFASTGAYKPITWWTSDLERMRLDASGNLGIGTASPLGRFHLCMATDVNALFRDAASVGLSSGTLIDNFNNAFGVTNPLYLRASQFIYGTDSGGSFTERMRLDASGNLGIGTTSPTQKLVVSNAGAAGFEFDPATGIMQTYNRSGAAYTAAKVYALNFEVRTGASPVTAMLVDSSGNLGIGTASPGAKLEVYGGASGTVTNIQAGNAATGFVFGIDGSNNCQVRTAQNVAMLFYTNATQRMQISADGNFFVGTAALATTATAGFPWIPSCPGIPTGAPTAPYTNAAAMVVDTTNNRLYVLVGSTWRYATLT